MTCLLLFVFLSATKQRRRISCQEKGSFRSFSLLFRLCPLCTTKSPTISIQNRVRQANQPVGFGPRAFTRKAMIDSPAQKLASCTVLYITLQDASTEQLIQTLHVIAREENHSSPNPASCICRKHRYVASETRAAL
jgi:hypothetical protein